MTVDNTQIFFNASREVFERTGALIQDFCSKKKMVFKSTETLLISNTRYWTILCGQYNAILQDSDNHLSVRTLIRKYGTKPGLFTPVSLSDRQYTMQQGADGNAIWTPQDHSGRQTGAQGIAALCLQDIVNAIATKGGNDV